MKEVLAYVDGKPIYNYKKKGCMCGCDCNPDKPIVFVDETTGKKYEAIVKDGKLELEEYTEEASGDTAVVGTAIVGKSKVA